MTTINVKYIGQKDRKEDNVASSGLVWHGHGDVQQATPAQWAQLSKHPGVWERAEDQHAAGGASLALGHKAGAGGLTTDQVHGILFPSGELAEKAATPGEVSKANPNESPRRRRAAATPGEVS